MTDPRQIFLEHRPLLDVRAPAEFARGAFPTSVNLPILNDEQREQVGICYKEHGPVAAEALGYQLVAPERDALIEGWRQFLTANPDALLYCFRGGKRSQITELWLRDANVLVERIEGGYKRLRQFLLDQLQHPPPVILLSGKTGVGKTELLPRLQHSVDLEGLANHRGSAFGGYDSPQPAQIDFENALAIELLRHKASVVLEDESRLIGKIHLPPSLQEAMKAAPICLLEDSISNRVRRILEEYVVLPLQNRTPETLHSELQNSINAIKNRLGGVRYQALTDLLSRAFASQHNALDAHRVWIEKLLIEYYDPMYDYQLNKKQGRIHRRINWQDVPKDGKLDLSADAR